MSSTFHNKVVRLTNPQPSEQEDDDEDNPQSSEQHINESLEYSEQEDDDEEHSDSENYMDLSDDLHISSDEYDSDSDSDNTIDLDNNEDISDLISPDLNIYAEDDNSDLYESEQDGIESLGDSDDDVNPLPSQSNTTTTSTTNNTIVHKYTNQYYSIFYDQQFISSTQYTDQEHIFFVYIYIVCNNTYQSPYVITTLKYDNGYYTLPYINNKPDVLSTFTTEQNIDKITELKNKIFNQIVFPIFNIKPEDVNETFMNAIQNSITGFYDIDDSKTIVGIQGDYFISHLMGNNLTVTDYFLKPKKDNIPSHMCVGISEIIDKKHVYNIPIEHSIIDLFNDQQWLYSILKPNREISEIPMVLHNCIFENNKVVLNDEYQLIPFKSNIQNEESSYYFTDKLVGQFETPRYIVFLGNSLKTDTNNVLDFWKNVDYNSFQFTTDNTLCIGLISPEPFQFHSF